MIREHTVLEITDEIDALGTAATNVLRAHGVRWPGNTYMHTPIFEVARGGAVLTGVGGDELFGTRGARLTLIRHGEIRPRLRDVSRLAAALLPRRVRALSWRWRQPMPMPWLTGTGRAQATRATARDMVAWPHRWDASLRHWVRTRAFTGVRTALPAIAAEFDVRVINPFVEANVLAELVLRGGATGFASRAHAVAELVGDALPAEVRDRQSKAAFTTPAFGPATRQFAREWDGAGVDARWVDAEVLRAEWLSESPDFRTSLLLHTAWLAQANASTN
jgi:asparagine synthase (glutamine-hydrolysing)